MSAEVLHTPSGEPRSDLRQKCWRLQSGWRGVPPLGDKPSWQGAWGWQELIGAKKIVFFGENILKRLTQTPSWLLIYKNKTSVVIMITSLVCFSFFLFLTGCWRTIQASKVLDVLWGPGPICLRSHFSGEICVAVFCSIRSSKQTLIKKQLLTSSLSHKPTSRHTKRQKYTNTSVKVTWMNSVTLMHFILRVSVDRKHVTKQRIAAWTALLYVLIRRLPLIFPMLFHKLV